MTEGRDTHSILASLATGTFVTAYLIIGACTCIWSLVIVIQTWGLLGAAIGLTVFPLTYVVVPLYALVTHWNWILPILAYSPWLLFLIGRGKK